MIYIMICPPCTHFPFFFDCFCFLCLSLYSQKLYILLYIFRIASLIPYSFLWLGRESCWLTGLPQSPPSWHAHVSSCAQMHLPPFTIWGSTARRIPGLPRHRMVQNHSTPAGEQIPWYTPLHMPPKKTRSSKCTLKNNTYQVLSSQISLHTSKNIYIYIYTFEKSRNVWSSNYTGQQLAAGFSICVFHQSTSTVQCCIRVVLPLTRSTKLRAADKDTFLKQVQNIITNTPHSLVHQPPDCSRKVPYV